MGPWSFFFSANVRFKPNAAQSAEWNRGAYVAESHCGDGHTPGNLAFALDNRSDRPPLSGPGGMLVECWPLRQRERGRRSRLT